jgi:hypothetical protein
VDLGLVDQAIDEINRLWVLKTLDAVLAIGDCVLRLFFGGDSAHYRSRARKHASFRFLAGHDDLGPSASFLSRAVGTFEQARTLPPEVVAGLTAANHSQLLAIRDLEYKRTLAQRAVRERWSARRLAAVIRSEREDTMGPRPGRRPTPDLVRGLRQIAHAIDTTLSGPLSFEGIAPPIRAAMLTRLERDLVHLQAVRDRLDAIPRSDGTGRLDID